MCFNILPEYTLVLFTMKTLDIKHQKYAALVKSQMLRKLLDLIAHICILSTEVEGFTMSLGQFKVFSELQVGLDGTFLMKKKDYKN